MRQKWRAAWYIYLFSATLLPRADVYPRSGLTPYARFGNYPVLFGTAMTLAAAVWRRRRGMVS